MKFEDITKTDRSFAEKDRLDYYWKYYELQSNQRNQLCTFYFTSLSVLIALVPTMLPDSKNYIWIIFLLIAVLALVFGLMYQRTTTLRNHARRCLINFEEELFREDCIISKWKMVKIFEYEEKKKNSHTTIMYCQFVFVGAVSFFTSVVMVINNLLV